MLENNNELMGFEYYIATNQDEKLKDSILDNNIVDENCKEN